MPQLNVGWYKCKVELAATALNIPTKDAAIGLGYNTP